MLCTLVAQDAVCGDGILQPAGADGILNTADDEFCDDGNTDDGDGCDAYCSIEITEEELIEPDLPEIVIPDPIPVPTTQTTGDDVSATSVSVPRYDRERNALILHDGTGTPDGR